MSSACNDRKQKCVSVGRNLKVDNKTTCLLEVKLSLDPGVHNRGGSKGIWNHQLANVCRVNQKTSVDPQSEW